MFKPGDKIICIEPGIHTNIKRNEIYTVRFMHNDKVYIENNIPCNSYYPYRFKLLYTEPKKPMTEIEYYEWLANRE